MIAFHLIVSAYGFWLPNDPRGSWSDFVASWELYKFGGTATKVNDARSYAHEPHDACLRRHAKEHLKYPAVRFDARQRSEIARGFGIACDDSGYLIPACCIGYDHAHLIIEHHAREITSIAGHLKSAATRSLTSAGVHPLNGFIGKRGGLPTPWSEGCWKVFIDRRDQLESAIAYVERHPLKENMSRQDWAFCRRSF